MHNAVCHLGEAIREQRMGGTLLLGLVFKITFGLLDSPALMGIAVIGNPMSAV